MLVGMLDTVFRRLGAPLLDRLAGSLAGSLAGRGQVVSLVGFVVSLAGAALISRHFAGIGLIFFALGSVLAALAARLEPQPLGFLFAAVSFAAIPFAFALASPQRALSLIFLLFGMTVEAVARARLGPGFIGEGELLLVFVLLAIFPGGLVAYIAGVLCFVSAGSAARRIG